jgi:hypothetical protein
MSEAGVAVGPSVGGVSIDGLVDGAMEAMEADGVDLEGLEGIQEPAGATKAAKAKEAPATVPDEVLEPAEGDELELEAEEDTRGTKAEPLSIKDLPDDRFIKLKINGEEAVVSLRELADGHIREATFRQKAGEAKTVVEQATRIAQQAKQGRETDRATINALLQDPERLFEFYTQDDHTESVLEALAIRYAKLKQSEKANPHAKTQRQVQREQARLAKERQDFESRRQHEERTSRESAATQRRSAELKPAWEAGLKEAGFPQVTAELQDLVKANVMAVTNRTGKPIAPEEFKSIVVRAAKFLGSKPAVGKPQPAPKLAPKPSQAQRRATSNPHRKGSVESLLWGMKPPRI